MRNKTFVTVLIIMVMAGLWATAGHYLVPRPTGQMLETMNIAPGPQWFLEQLPRYDRHAVIAALHVVPSFIFMLLILFQLSGRLRQRYLQVHRWTGRVFVVLGFVIGISGLMLGVIMPFGGAVESLAVFLIGIGFLYSLTMGVMRIRQGRIAEHRHWMLYMTAFGFAPITMRLLLGIGMYTTDFTGPALFGPTMLLGMLLNLWVLHRFVLGTRLRAGVQNRPMGNRIQES